MTLATTARPVRISSRSRPIAASRPIRMSGMASLVVAEAIASVIGFVVLLRVARVLGPTGFAATELATTVAGIMLVWVRSGVESIALREAARAPRLIPRIASSLVLVKLVAASLGFLPILLVGLVSGGKGGSALWIGGLILFPSAFVVDLEPRASGRLGIIAGASILRAFALALAAFGLVTCPDRILEAASLLALAEMIPVLVLTSRHLLLYGRPQLPSIRLCVALARRGATASLARFGRVALYGIDLVILAVITNSQAIGPYAAARRVVFALIGLALVYPAAIAPALTRAWGRGAVEARAKMLQFTADLLAILLPASLGLVLLAGSWMTILFGPSYRGSGPCLSLIAARLPLVVVSTLFGTTLVSVRGEIQALRQTAITLGIAVPTVALAALAFGTLGAGGAMVGAEAVGLVIGWKTLDRLKIAPPSILADRGTLAASLVLMVVVLAARPAGPWVASGCGAAAYGSAWWLSRRISRR